MTRRTDITYEESGVSIETAGRIVEFLKDQNRTIGGFSGLFPLQTAGLRRPVLVASTDGVGTKLLIAKEARKLGGLGIDLVAMVVNDLIVCGATPLFFLDYYAAGKLDAREARRVLSGILKGCEIAGCPLIGGETAELPGIYAQGDFDLAGFGIGIVEADELIDGKNIKIGDLVYGFESTGLHSNGYSLARGVLLDRARIKLSARVPSLGKNLADVLLRQTRIYVSLARELKRSRAKIKALAHITGGGIPGNLCRVLPSNVDAIIRKGSWTIPPIFNLIQQNGPVPETEMFKVFNMGIGFVAVAPASEQKRIATACRKSGDKVHVIGEIAKGSAKARVIAS